MNKTLTLLIIVFFTVGTSAQALTQQWATSYAGTGENASKFNSVIRDGSGNLYAGGYTWNAGNGKDFLLAKLNSSGDTLWTRTYDGVGNGNDEINELAFDNSGNIVAAGYSKTLTGKDFTIYKFNTNGDSLWVVNYNYTGNIDDIAVDVVTDASGNIYAGGYGYNTNLNIDYVLVKYNSSGVLQATGTFNGIDNLDDVLADIAIDGSNNIIATGKSRTAVNKDDYATVKFNSSLAVQWTKTLDQANKTDRATGVFIDASGNAYVTGRSSDGTNDDFVTVQYLSASGNQGWLKTVSAVNLSYQAKAIDGNANEVVVTGTSFNGTQYDILTVAYSLSNGTQLWSTPYANANGKDETPNHIAVDASGNVIVTGTTNVSTTTSTNNDVLVLKYNNSGVQQWAKITGGSANLDDNGSMTLQDGTGNIYTVGALLNSATIKGAAVLEVNAGGTSLQTKTYNGIGEYTDKGVALCMSNGSVYSTGYVYNFNQDRDICTIKYDGAGNKVWVKTYNGAASNTDEPVAIAADVSGNIYVGGRSKNPNGDYDMLLIKYNTNGDTVWTRSYDGGVSGDDEINDLAVDASGNIYVTGTTDRDASLLVNNDFLTLKYSAAGNILWQQQFNGTANADDKAYSLALDPNANVYITGKTFNGTDYDIQTTMYATSNGTQVWSTAYTSNLGDDVPVKIKTDASQNVIVGAKSDRAAGAASNIDFLIVKYNSSGTQQWAKLYNGSGNGDDDLNNLTVDATGNIYAVGSIDADASAGVNFDYATVAYNTSGTLLWDSTFSGAANGIDAAYGVAVDGNGNIYVTGESNQGIAPLKNNNIVTVAYSTSGAPAQYYSYDGPVNLSDGGNAVLFDNTGLYVTGFATNNVVEQKDFLTMKYGISTGINEISSENKLIVYPNPVQANAQLHFVLNAPFESASCCLLDVLGNLTGIANISANGLLDLSNFHLSNGVYFVRVTSNLQQSSVSKIIVE